jgi:hypothetical protein
MKIMGHATVALSLEKKRPVQMGYEADWAADPAWVQ